MTSAPAVNTLAQPRFPLALSASLVAIALLAWLSWSFFHDDAYITLRYVQRWLASEGLGWTAGPPVEGYTHPLWLLQIAALGAVGLDLPVAARALGLTYLLAIVILWSRQSARPIALLVFVTLPGTVVWSVSGLETTSFAFLCLSSCRILQGALEAPTRARALSVGGVFFLATLTRPEAAGLAMLAVGWIAVARAWTSALAALLGFAVPLALFLALRWHVYGELLSTSSITKVDGLGLLFNVGGGLDYVARHAVLSTPAVLYFLLAALGGRRRQRAWVPLSMATALLAAAIGAGGDHMPYGRFLVPVFALLAWAAGVADPVHRRVGKVSPLGVASKLALLANTALWVLVPSIPPDPAAAYGASVGRFLAQHLPQGTLVAASTAGSTAYFAPDLEFVDMLGLNDPVIARRAVSALETAWQFTPGHLKGDGAYVLSRRPDVIILGPALGFLGHAPNRWFLSDLELLRDPRFGEQYEPFAFAVPSEWLEALGHVPERVWDLSTGLPFDRRPEAIARALAENPDRRFVLIAFLRRDAPRTARLAAEGASLDDAFESLRPEFVPICSEATGLRGHVPCHEGPPPDSRRLGDVGVPRHVLLVIIDTLRADGLGAHGNLRPTSPNLDQLAREGITFEAAFSAAPATLESLTTVFTGTCDLSARDPVGALPSDWKSLPQHFHDAGFRTFGVVANPWLALYPSLFRAGFDHYWSAVDWDLSTVNSTDRVTHEALRMLERGFDPARKNFVYVHYLDPHDPYASPKSYGFHQGEAVEPFDVHAASGEAELIARFESTGFTGPPTPRTLTPAQLDWMRASYDEEIRHVDTGVGELLEFLDRAKALPETLVVVTSDQGESFLDHGLLEHGFQLYDEALHVPLIFYWTGRLRAERRSDLASGVDLAPTLLARIARVAPRHMRGFDLFGGARGDEPVPLRTHFVNQSQRGLRTERYKLIHDRLADRYEVYDLERDPGERRNLYGDGRHWIDLVTRLDALERRHALAATSRSRRSDPPPDETVRSRLEALGYVAD